MHEKNKFFLFVFALVLIALSLFYINKNLDPKAKYSHQELELDFTNKKDLPEEKLAFMNSIIRAAQYSNYKILEDRDRLVRIKNAFVEDHDLSSLYKHYLKNIQKSYGVKQTNDADSVIIIEVLNELEEKVQIVPVRLTLAQAILESAWGGSRFAKEANAYFGIHCYSAGCGLVIGDGSKKVYVKSYANLQASVDDYMRFLNSKPGPKNFRKARCIYLDSGDTDINNLAKSLDSYSEIGGDYQKILSDLFRNYIPDEIEDY